MKRLLPETESQSRDLKKKGNKNNFREIKNVSRWWKKSIFNFFSRSMNAECLLIVVVRRVCITIKHQHQSRTERRKLNKKPLLGFSSHNVRKQFEYFRREVILTSSKSAVVYNLIDDCCQSEADDWLRLCKVHDKWSYQLPIRSMLKWKQFPIGR